MTENKIFLYVGHMLIHSFIALNTIHVIKCEGCRHQEQKENIRLLLVYSWVVLQLFNNF